MPTFEQKSGRAITSQMAGTTLPATCLAGDLYVKTDNPAGQRLYTCDATNTWVQLTGGGGSSFPVGGIILIVSGTCPAGFAEETTISGKFVLGTVAANADIGTAGGSDSVTPTGTVSQPTFTGDAFSSIINHTHAGSVTDSGHTHLTQRYPTATGSSSGFTIDTSMSGTLADNTLPTKIATTGITATTSNPASGVASITPTGTVTQPVFTGNSQENRPAFIKVIFCRKT